MDYTAEDIAAVFGRAAQTYDTIVPFFTRFGAELLALANLRPGESVLDIGAGRGATLIPAAEIVGPVGRVVGVDLSQEMIALLVAELEGRGLTNASVRRMDAEALELDPGSFDVAVSSLVFHLLLRPDAAARGVERALRPGGRVAASAPTAAGPHWDFLFRLYEECARRAIRPIPMPFREDFNLASLLADAGFEVVHSGEQALEFVFADEREWWAWAWSAGMRALFESLGTSDLEGMRREAFREVAALRTADGITLHQTARLVLARKRS